MLQEDPLLLLHQLSEEEERGNLQTSSNASNASLASADSPVREKKPSKKKWIRRNMPSSARGQPVGKETLQQASEPSKMLIIITEVIDIIDILNLQ